jgi:hypothetical protein
VRVGLNPFSRRTSMVVLRRIRSIEARAEYGRDVQDTDDAALVVRAAAAPDVLACRMHRFKSE